MNNDLSNESVAWRKLRPYQAAAVETVDLRLSVPGPLVRGYVELPTGSGKTVIAAELAARSYARHPLAQTLFVAHRRELVLQQAAELERWSGLRTAVLMAGCEFDPTAPLIAASIQTLAARGMARDFQPKLALIDEIHHAAVGSEYDRVLGRRDMHLIGFSATPRRSWERPAPVLTECLFARGLPELIAEDWLAPLRSERIVAPMNLVEIANHNGDYAEPVLAVQALRGDVIDAIIEAAAPRILERPGAALCFGVTVEHAQRLAAAFTDAGIATACVWGEQPTVSARLPLRRGVAATYSY
jgi:superfamily II DNA or RNA helicase